MGKATLKTLHDEERLCIYGKGDRRGARVSMNSFGDEESRDQNSMPMRYLGPLRISSKAK
jgi:hypothetical protein